MRVLCVVVGLSVLPSLLAAPSGSAESFYRLQQAQQAQQLAADKAVERTARLKRIKAKVDAQGKTLGEIEALLKRVAHRMSLET